MITDRVIDSFLVRAIHLERLSVSEQRAVVRVLAGVQKEITATLSALDPLSPKAYTQRIQRLRALLPQVEAILKQGYGEIGKISSDSLGGLVKSEAGWLSKTYENAVGFNILSAGIGDEEAKALVSDTLIEGAPAAEWWGRQVPVVRDRFADEMRKGFAQNETMDQLIRRVTGTKAKGFKDGISEIARASAERITRTSILSVSNAARETTYKNNAEVIRGVQAVATLDTRTSLICIARNGSAWDPKTGKALPESPRQEDYPGPPPWHWRCRSTLVAVLKSYEDLIGARGRQFDRNLKDIGPGDRASMDGSVSKSLSFGDWLKSVPESRADTLLGKGRKKLWQDGKITLSQLIDQNGRPLTLKELDAL